MISRPAELAHRHHREITAADIARAGHEFAAHDTEKPRDDALGDIGESRSGLIGARCAFDHLHADAEDLLLGKQACGIERGFVIERFPELLRQGAVEFVPLGQFAQKSRVHQRIEHARRARQIIGDRGADPQTLAT